MSLRTFAGGLAGPSPKDGHLHFFPAVTFLSADKTPIATLFDEKPVSDYYGWSGVFTFVGKVRIPDNAAYAVIHTLPSKLGESYMSDYAKMPGMTTMAGGSVISTPSRNYPMRARYVSTGKVMVSVSD